MMICENTMTDIIIYLSLPCADYNISSFFVTSLKLVPEALKNKNDTMIAS